MQHGTKQTLPGWAPRLLLALVAVATGLALLTSTAGAQTGDAGAAEAAPEPAAAAAECDPQTALVDMLIRSGERSGTDLTRLGARAGENVSISWKEWAPGCEAHLSIAVHASGERLFDPGETEPLIDSVSCVGDECRDANGRYLLTLPVPETGYCVAEVDIVLGAPLPAVGPPTNFYSSVFSKKADRLVGFARAELNAEMCGQPLPATADPVEAAPTEEPVVVLGDEATNTTAPEATPAENIPVVADDTLAFTGPSAASRNAGVVAIIAILTGLAMLRVSRTRTITD